MYAFLLACTEVAPVHVDWDETCNPMATGDDCLTPFPSSHWTVEDPDSPTGVRTAYSNANWHSPDGELPVDIDAMFSGYDGVSPVTPAYVALGEDVDPAFLYGWGEQGLSVEPGAAIALIDVETGELVPVQAEMDQNNRDGYSGRHALIVRPLAPMAFGHRHAVVLTSALTDVDGNAFTSPPVFEALRDDVITDSDAIEAMRPAYQDLFAVVEDAAWEREDLLLAWEFQVASEHEVLGPILSMKEQALAEDATWVIDEVVVEDDVSVHYGSFTPPNFLDENDEIHWDGSSVTRVQDPRSYDLTIAVPLTETTEPRPLILIGHGLFGNGRSMIESDLVQTMATRLDAVLVATDWIGLSSGDRDLILQEVLPDLARVNLVTDRLAQSHVNNLSLVEAMIDGVDDIAVDPDRVWYYGISLGGIQGASQTALSDRIDRSVLAVPGAGWAGMIQRSVHFEQLDQVLDLYYADPLGQGVFLGMVQSRFDRSDPGSIATLLREQDKTVILQEAIGDCQVPNNATDLLARSVGAVQLGTPTDPVWGLDEVEGPVTGRALTQIRVPDDLDVYFPADENTIPEMDNGVHNSAVLNDVVYDQIFHLFATGEAIHPCDGACDPG